jgi:hypothetical protein
MTAYIIDTHNLRIEKTYPDSSYASYAMSDNYGWEPDKRYKMFHNKEALYVYFEECHDGRDIRKDIIEEMFLDWIKDYP